MNATPTPSNGCSPTTSSGTCPAPSAPFFGEAARWLADRLSVEIVTLTGGHAPYLDHHEEMAKKIRPLLRQGKPA